MASRKKKSKNLTKKKLKTSNKLKTKSSKKLSKKSVRKTPKKSKVKKVSFLPKGYTNVTAYLFVNLANEAINFYKKVFNAKEMMRMSQPNGKVAHAELKIGDTKIMLADECKEMQALSPQSIGGTPVGLHLYVKNVDLIIQQALAEGARLLRPAQDMFYGDRSAAIEDPYGHRWFVSTHIEDVTPAQTRKRAAELYGDA